MATTGSSSSPYMYSANAGYRDEGDAGLIVAGARMYDKQVGRFITRDTVLVEHPFLYCDGDPVNCVDPDGHLPLGNDVVAAVLGGAGGAAVSAVRGEVGIAAVRDGGGGGVSTDVSRLFGPKPTNPKPFPDNIRAMLDPYFRLPKPDPSPSGPPGKGIPGLRPPPPPAITINLGGGHTVTMPIH